MIGQNQPTHKISFLEPAIFYLDLELNLTSPDWSVSWMVEVSYWVGPWRLVGWSVGPWLKMYNSQNMKRRGKVH